ncbi:MAG: SCO family protein [Desulfurococcales archaeon]|nr:SCO family protein [Desulfurococcales archaeon]
MPIPVKAVVLALVVGLAISIGVAFTVGQLIVKPKVEQSMPYENINGIGVSIWNKPLQSFTVNSTAGMIEIPVKGKVNVITPQYVRCPDICHLESQMMIYAMEQAVKEGVSNDIVFITLDVDPWTGTYSMALDYQSRVAGDMLDDVEWIWVLDSVDKMQEIYKAYDIYVEFDNKTKLVNHFGGFLITDRNGKLVYIIHPDWNRVYDTAVVLWDKIYEVLKGGG